MEYREPRLGNKHVKAQVALVGLDNHGLAVLMTQVHFQNVTQDDILKWLTRLVEAIPALQRTLLPTEHRIALAAVTGVEVPLNDEGEVVDFQWAILADNPDRVIIPPYPDSCFGMAELLPELEESFLKDEHRFSSENGGGSGIVGNA